MNKEQARDYILKAVKDFCDTFHNADNEYKKGDRIPYASHVYDAEEMVNLVDSALEFWLTSGRYTDEFERELRQSSWTDRAFLCTLSVFLCLSLRLS